MVIEQPSIVSENLISAKNESDEPPEESLVAKASIFANIEKSAKSKRGRPPKTFSSSVSTCSENSNKNVYLFSCHLYRKTSNFARENFQGGSHQDG